MRRAPCPRCGRPDGIPIVYGLPDDELVRRSGRGEVELGGCVLFGGDPDFRCATCRHDWVDGPLPPWWPPSDVEHMDPKDRQVSTTLLEQRYRTIRAVALAVLDMPPAVAREEVARLADDPWSDLDDPFDGIVVPTDRVLQAEALNAAAAVCRALGAVDDGVELDSRYAALHAAIETFHRADRGYQMHGDVDVLRPEEDEDEEDWPCDEDRLTHLVGTGTGDLLPPAGEQWDEWLDATATTLFDDGSALGWARFVWSRLATSGLTTVETELDLARAQVRLVALDVLRRTLLARLDGDDVEEWRYWVHDPGIDTFHLGVLAGIAGVEPGYDLEYAEQGTAESDALVELVRAESDRLASALVKELGVAQVFALTWASRYTGARYPLAPDAMDEAVNSDLTPEKHMTYEWVDGGMGLL